MEAEAIGALLARTNAALNLSSGILLTTGWVFIRWRQVSRHRLLTPLDSYSKCNKPPDRTPQRS